MTWLDWFGSWISWEFLVGVAISFGILLIIYWVRVNFAKVIYWYGNWSRDLNDKAFQAGLKWGEGYNKFRENKNGTELGNKYNGFKGNKVQSLPKPKIGKGKNNKNP